MPFYRVASILLLLDEIDRITRALRGSYAESDIVGDMRIDVQRGLNIVR